MKNPLKDKLRKGKVLIGAFVNFGHTDVAELLSHLEFDYILLDMEHTSIDLSILQRMMQAMSGSSCVPIVRPPTNDPVVIKRILDIGAYGIVIPMVNSREEAKNAVRACKYPPEGIRGYGPRRAGLFDPSYFETANDEILVMVIIETWKAVENIDEILSVKGIDMCDIGHNDLSIDMGLGIPLQWDNPRFLDAYERVVKAAKKYGVVYGFNYKGDFNKCVKKGCGFIEAGTDDSFFIEGACRALKRVRQAVSAAQKQR